MMICCIAIIGQVFSVSVTLKLHSAREKVCCSKWIKCPTVSHNWEHWKPSGGFSIKQIVQVFHRVLPLGSFFTCSLLICDVLTKAPTEICRALWSVLRSINFLLWSETNLPFSCFLLQMGVSHRMGGSLAIDSSIVQVLPRRDSVTAMGGFYRLVPEHNAHAGLTVIVEIFLIFTVKL